MWCFWSASGGVGCSTVAAVVAIEAGGRGPTLLVDLGGDSDGGSADLLGLERPADGMLGVGDWFDAPDPPPDALARLERPVADSLSLLPWGGATGSSDLDRVDRDGRVDRVDRAELLARLLLADERTVVVDLGRLDGRRWQRTVLALAARSTAVARPCYLTLRRLASLAPPDEVVLVTEPGRSLGADDVAGAVDALVTVTVRRDPAVARAVDAGVLLRRRLRSLRPLRGLTVGGRR